MPEIATAPRRRLVFVPSGAVRLEAALEMPSGARGIVVFAHGSGSSHASPRNRYVARRLHEAGFGTLLFDLLTEEEDADGAARFDVALMTHRLADALRWLAQPGTPAAMPIALFGASGGAAAALEVAAMPEFAIVAMVLRGGRVDLATPRTVSRVRAPTLLVVGAADTAVVIANQGVYERLQCEKDLEILPGATHLFEEPGALERVAGLACAWITAHTSQAALASASTWSPRPS